MARLADRSSSAILRRRNAKFLRKLEAAKPTCQSRSEIAAVCEASCRKCDCCCRCRCCSICTLSLHQPFLHPSPPSRKNSSRLVSSKSSAGHVHITNSSSRSGSSNSIYHARAEGLDLWNKRQTTEQHIIALSHHPHVSTLTSRISYQHHGLTVRSSSLEPPPARTLLQSCNLPSTDARANTTHCTAAGNDRLNEG